MKVPPFLFLLLYLSATLRPIWPVLADVVAHTLWHHEHLERVHSKHGEQHLHFELKASASDSPEHGALPVPAKSAKTSDSVQPHLAAETESTKFPFRLWMLRERFSPFLFPVAANAQGIAVPPPKCA